MKCVYLLNENPVFYSMFSVSIRMLRKYNQKIPVQLLYIQDEDKDSWGETRKIIEHVGPSYLHYLTYDKNDLFDLCSDLNVDIEICPKLETPQNYTPIHRHYLQKCSDEACLLLDSDTFIFNNVELLFDQYKNADFIAHPMMSISKKTGDMSPIQLVMTYAKNQKIKKISMYPFNSGVVLWNNGWMKRYGEVVVQMCDKLKHKKHLMSEMMYTLREDGRNREELACSLFVLENDLKLEYFRPKHVETFKFSSNPVVFHTTSSAWASYFNFFAKEKCLVFD